MRFAQFALACAVTILITISTYGVSIGPSALGEINDLSDAQLAARIAQEQAEEIRRELQKEKRWRDFAPPLVRNVVARL